MQIITIGILFVEELRGYDDICVGPMRANSDFVSSCNSTKYFRKLLDLVDIRLKGLLTRTTRLRYSPTVLAQRECLLDRTIWW